MLRDRDGRKRGFADSSSSNTSNEEHFNIASVKLGRHN
jgi:hypothetical protein